MKMKKSIYRFAGVNQLLRRV